MVTGCAHEGEKPGMLSGVGSGIIESGTIGHRIVTVSEKSIKDKSTKDKSTLELSLSHTITTHAFAYNKQPSSMQQINTRLLLGVEELLVTESFLLDPTEKKVERAFSAIVHDAEEKELKSNDGDIKCSDAKCSDIDRVLKETLKKFSDTISAATEQKGTNQKSLAQSALLLESACATLVEESLNELQKVMQLSTAKLPLHPIFQLMYELKVAIKPFVTTKDNIKPDNIKTGATITDTTIDALFLALAERHPLMKALFGENTQFLQDLLLSPQLLQQLFNMALFL